MGHWTPTGIEPMDYDEKRLTSKNFLSAYFCCWAGTKNLSFIHSVYFHIASSSPLLLRGAPDTARILCQSFTPKRHRQLRENDLPKVTTWRLERDSNSEQRRLINQ